ncbi:reverse transcriptase domain-containing protein, partial [Tanacetum coccineum]
MEEDELVLIILGRPFLATAKAVIDVHEGKLSLRVRSETITFNIGKSMKSKHFRDDYLYCADHTAKLIQEQWVDTANHDRKWTEEEEEEDSSNALVVSFYPRTEPVEPLEWKAPDNRLKPSNVEPPKVDLNELPEHLKYFQIPIALEDQEKTTFTCPYGTFAYKQMSFVLCNAPATFQCCMTTIFHELIDYSMEVFMDDFSVFGSSFDHYLKNLEKVLKRCEETNLVLNWEKWHFMVKEGIILGHKVLGFGIKVDKAKIKATSKLPYPTNVKAIRSFLGYADFYR